MTNQLVVGGLYLLPNDNRPSWLLAADEVQVFYDVWWDHTNNWSLRSSNARTIFPRCFAPSLISKGSQIGYEEISIEEISKYKLNLPMKFCRFSNFHWGLQPFGTMEEFATHCNKLELRLSNEMILSEPKILINAKGPTGGMKSGVMIEAKNGKWFSETELLWQAYNIQAKFKNNIQEGVGIHRLGWEKKVASYYIGGYYDDADYLRMYENMHTTSDAHKQA